MLRWKPCTSAQSLCHITNWSLGAHANYFSCQECLPFSSHWLYMLHDGELQLIWCKTDTLRIKYKNAKTTICSCTNCPAKMIVPQLTNKFPLFSLGNPKVHCNVHKNCSVDLILSLMNSSSPQCNITLPRHQKCWLEGFHLMYAFLIFPMRTIFPHNSICLI
jgi:hypothetical protein